MDNQISATVVNEQVLNTLKPAGSGKKWLLRIVLLISVILIIFGGYYLFNKYFRTQPTNQQTVSEQTSVANSQSEAVLPVGDAELSLLSGSNKYLINSKVPIDLQLATSGRIISRVEISVKYDPSRFVLDDKPFTSGKIFTKEPTIAKGLNNDLVRITGDIGESGKGYNGIDVLGTLNFTAKTEGTSIFTIESPAKAKGSTVVNLLSKKNILGKTYGIEITISKQ